ncbi:hypothetical protein MMC13_005735 [Lambiella insularis]|nr:hypothetical protein [Lambiella insularis]
MKVPMAMLSMSTILFSYLAVAAPAETRALPDPVNHFCLRGGAYTLSAWFCCSKKANDHVCLMPEDSTDDLKMIRSEDVSISSGLIIAMVAADELHMQGCIPDVPEFRSLCFPDGEREVLHQETVAARSPTLDGPAAAVDADIVDTCAVQEKRNEGLQDIDTPCPLEDPACDGLHGVELPPRSEAVDTPCPLEDPTCGDLHGAELPPRSQAIDTPPCPQDDATCDGLHGVELPPRSEAVETPCPLEDPACSGLLGVQLPPREAAPLEPTCDLCPPLPPREAINTF